MLWLKKKSAVKMGVAIIDIKVFSPVGHRFQGLLLYHQLQLLLALLFKDLTTVAFSFLKVSTLLPWCLCWHLNYPGCRLAVSFCSRQENGNIIHVTVTSRALPVVTKDAAYTV